MDPVAWYNNHAGTVGNLYEGLTFEDAHGWLLDLLPAKPGLVLDVGAGSGRDAAWLAAHGHEVVAVEPAVQMRREAHARHGDARIRWIDDRLPGLEATIRLGLTFDFILASAVWMHVPAEQRSRAFRKLLSLLKPGGTLAITLRHGAAEDDRGIHPTTLVEIETLARAHGAVIDRALEAPDRLGRADVTWTQVAIRLPDDGTGALPLLRHIILSEAKSSTYKLALLRAVARIADGAPGMARDAGDDEVSIPLGLVGLYWLRLFKPLIEADLPQSPTNRGANGLGFAGPGYRAIRQLTHLDLRIGMRFSSDNSAALHQALKESCRTVAEMPATYMTYPNGGGPVLKTTRRSRYVRPDYVVLDEQYLASFGEMLVPRHIWRALVRFDAWIEPAILAEWTRLMKLYAERQGRHLDPGITSAAMIWSEPGRDVSLARQTALKLMDAGRPVRCVWSGRQLTREGLDMDHGFPWAAWPCDDLWNILPANRTINQRQKRDRLPSAATLLKAQGPIIEWWADAYAEGENKVLAHRFFHEARAALPLATTAPQVPLEDIFGGVVMKRLAIRQDQQLDEWEGTGDG